MQDLSGRPHLSFDLDIPTDRIGTYETQLVEHFFQSLANTSGMTLHIRHVPIPCLSGQLLSPRRDCFCFCFALMMPILPLCADAFA